MFINLSYVHSQISHLDTVLMFSKNVFGVLLLDSLTTSLQFRLGIMMTSLLNAFINT